MKLFQLEFNLISEIYVKTESLKYLFGFEIRKAFNDIDKYKQGFINENNIRDYIKLHFKYITINDSKILLNKIDFDGDGKINLLDFSTFMEMGKYNNINNTNKINILNYTMSSNKNNRNNYNDNDFDSKINNNNSNSNSNININDYDYDFISNKSFYSFSNRDKNNSSSNLFKNAYGYLNGNINFNINKNKYIKDDEDNNNNNNKFYYSNLSYKQDKDINIDELRFRKSQLNPNFNRNLKEKEIEIAKDNYNNYNNINEKEKDKKYNNKEIKSKSQYIINDTLYENNNSNINNYITNNLNENKNENSVLKLSFFNSINDGVSLYASLIKEFIKMDQKLEKFKEKLAFCEDLEIQEIFKIFDLNKKGYFIYEEFKLGLSNINIIIDKETSGNLFKYIDRDSDGSISFNEFLEFITPKNPQLNNLFRNRNLVLENKNCLSLISINLVVDFFRLLIDNEMKIQSMKNLLLKKSIFNITDLFEMIKGKIRCFIIKKDVWCYFFKFLYFFYIF
jgi:Ca2+-binding EF-hand superfamily protein